MEVSHVKWVIEGSLRGRNEVELVKTEEVGDSRHIVGKHMLAEAHNATNVTPPPRAFHGEVELPHPLIRG